MSKNSLQQIKEKNVFKLVFTEKSVSLVRIRGEYYNNIPSDVLYKPISKKLEFRYVTAIKNEKKESIPTVNAVFSAIPSNPLIYYYCSQNHLYKINELFLMTNEFSNYKVDYEQKETLKAESREEMIRKEKSINYRMKRIEEEHYKRLEYQSNLK